jgi:hypothetical protein
MAIETGSHSTENGSVPSSSGARLAAPELLIHLHIAKTGGTSLSSMVKHGFRSEEVFESINQGEEVYNGLDRVTYESSERRLTDYGLNRIRYLSGHVPMGVHRVFDRPAKYMTVIRHPVDRVISYFFFRTQIDDPYLKNGKPLTFEEYVESRYDNQLLDYQVRVVSGSSDFEAAVPERGGQVFGTQVESRHLEEAKRNIEEHFMTIAQLEQMTDLALLLRRIYGWPMRRLQTEYKNPTKGRPSLKDIPPRLIRIVEDCNSHDMELYEWVGKRFTEQRQLFEPELSRDRRIFNIVNRALTTVGEVLPWGLRKRLAEILFYA